jgi:2-isopropylmalate synthase
MGSEEVGPLVEIFDTTLRDGTQREGVSLSAADKLRVAERLDQLGVAYIEGGWPGSNPKDAEFFARAKERTWQRAEIVAFGATRRADMTPAEDASVRALVDAGTRVVAIFGKTWTLHVDRVLRVARDENLRMIEETVAYLVAQGKRVIYDAEHFFDGWRADASYAIDTLEAAARGGAETVVLCDTNGGSLPWQIEETVRVVKAVLPDVRVGIHAHDDAGCGVANTLSAVRAGARHVQGTINGWGERCGNANLCAVIPDLELKLGMRCLPTGALMELTELSRFVCDVANLRPDDHMPYVGRSAFAHKGGVHVAAQRLAPGAYEHVEPARVGNATRAVVSELGGRATLMAKADERGVPLAKDDAAALIGHIKDRERNGFAFESAEASVELMMRRTAEGYEAPFKLIGYRVTCAQQEGADSMSEATLMVSVGGKVLHTASLGSGPVHALDGALRRALEPLFPEVARIRLVDYKVRIVDGRDGTAAITRVLVDASDGERRWSTLGASTNIVEASWQALADSIEYAVQTAKEESWQRSSCSPATASGLK